MCHTVLEKGENTGRRFLLIKMRRERPPLITGGIMNSRREDNINNPSIQIIQYYGILHETIKKCDYNIGEKKRIGERGRLSID